jgi:hypothetical protein
VPPTYSIATGKFDEAKPAVLVLALVSALKFTVR